MGDMKVVDLDQQLISFGAIPFKGWADGDAATVEFDGDAFNYTPGSDGEAVRSKNFNRSAVVTLRLIQSSVVNDLLSAIHTADMKAPNGAGVAPFQIKDNQGTTLLGGKQAWIQAPPNAVFASTGQVREWKIRVHQLEGIWGGN
jgi:hypothetical protein